MQLDIFEDSRGAMLRNDVLRAIEQRNAAAARSAGRALADHDPHDDWLAPLGVLIGALDAVGGAAVAVGDGGAGVADREGVTGAAPVDVDALRAAGHALHRKVGPAAIRLLGGAAGGTWLEPLWRTLARRAQAVPFRAEPGDDEAFGHAAPLWLRAGDWRAAAAAVAGIESWRRIPAPLGWMAEARCRQHGLDEAWPLLVELAWLAPARFNALAERLADPLLVRLRKSFGAAFEGAGAVDDWAWFPAWLLTDKPSLAPRLALAQLSLHGAPEVAMRLLLELLGLERQGRHADVVARRRVLRDTHTGLYAAYLRTR